jgi:hypothetical protein
MLRDVDEWSDAVAVANGARHTRVAEVVGRVAARLERSSALTTAR